MSIAAKYPGDVGIEADPDVLFVETFEEASLAAVVARWTNGELVNSAFSADVPAGSPGSQSLVLTAPKASLFQNVGGQGTAPLYVRCYFKYPSAATLPAHSGLWLGGNAPELNYPYVPSGTRPPPMDTAENDNYFSAAVEVVDSTGRLEHYNYWQGMHQDGGGAYWGNWLLMDPTCTITWGEWFCLETMVKINTPTSASNGEHAFWLNGVKKSHLGLGFPDGSWSGNRFTQHPGGTPFEGFQWTPTKMIFDTLDPNWVRLHSYRVDIPAPMLVDHLVVARKYIGPLAPAQVPEPPVGGSTKYRVSFSGELTVEPVIEPPKKP